MTVFNPFARRETHSVEALTTYRIFAILSWALFFIYGIFYSVKKPSYPDTSSKLWEQLGRRFNEFAVNVVVVAIYWILLLIAQVFYVFELFKKEEAAAANAAPYFILNNLFNLAWLLLYVRNHFWPAEVFVVLSFINQHVAFWRIRSLPPVTHLAVIAAPYAWTLISLFWTGAAAARVHTPGAEYAANVFTWIILIIGSVHIFLRADDLLGYSLSLLTFGLAVTQTDHKKNFDFQWIFAWVIFAVFLVESLYLTAVKYTNRDVFLRGGEQDSSDAERAPLLDDTPPAVPAGVA